MIKLITDTSCLFSVEQAKKMGFIVNPLSVAINGKTYREFEEINSHEFIEMINKGAMPTSSQPAMGEILESIEANIDDGLAHFLQEYQDQNTERFLLINYLR